MTYLTRRFLLIILLLIALPFQGFAQASRIVCDPGHLGHAGAVEQNIHVEHAEGAEGTYHGHDGHDADHHSNEGVAQLSPGSAQTLPHLDDKCNHCSPCCTGTAIFSQPVALILPTVMAQDFPAVAWAEDSITPSRLDRPPRFSFV